MMNKIFSYFKSLFERTDQVDKMNHKTLLESITLPSVTNDQKVVCNIDLTNKELFDALKGIPNDKYPGSDGLTKEFYEMLQDELKDFYKFSKVSLSKNRIKHFSTSSSYQIN